MDDRVDGETLEQEEINGEKENQTWLSETELLSMFCVNELLLLPYY